MLTKCCYRRLVSGRALHSAMEALGLTSYTVENMYLGQQDLVDLRLRQGHPAWWFSKGIKKKCPELMYL